MLPRTRLLTLALLGTLSLAGCSDSPPSAPQEDGAAVLSDAQLTSAAAAGSSSFYPLDVGNSWAYDGGGTLRSISGTEPPYSYSYANTESHRLIGTTHHEGTAYVVEEQVHHEIPESQYGPFTLWDRFRQDREGLFSLDTLLQSHPPLDEDHAEVARVGTYRGTNPYRIDLAGWRPYDATDASLERFAERIGMMREAARGVMRGGPGPIEPKGVELRRLAYPLRIGASWSIRPDFPWPARVSRFEIVATPAGRIPAFRIDIEPFGEPLQNGEWIRVWFSRWGYLGYSIHTISEGTNPDGSPSGVIYTADDWMTVRSVEIDRMGLPLAGR